MLPQRIPRSARPKPVPRVSPAVLVRVAEALRRWRPADSGDRVSDDYSTRWKDES